MLNIALGNTLSKEDFEQLDSNLRTRLLDLQQQFLQQRKPLLIVLCGIDGSGKGMLLSELSARMNPRLFKIHPFWHEERCRKHRPFYAKFWAKLPPAGHTAIHVGAWYDRVLAKATNGDDVSSELETIRKFEETLAANGMHILKIWTHLDKKEQKKRLREKKKLISTDKHILKQKILRAKSYKKNLAVVDKVLQDTHTDYAPWRVLDATEPHWLLAKTAEAILSSDGIMQPSASKIEPLPENRIRIRSKKTFPEIEQEQYRLKKKELQERLFTLTWEAYHAGRSPIFVFEGWDAAGKGGTIRRLTEAIDARLWSVYGSSAPNEIEKAHHYLWRYWRTLPEAGFMAIYDRSWYGRVLVERIEKFASHTEWKRAYREINDFEEQLVQSGAIISKFWLHISPEEQKRRFENREETEYKQYKITDEDWRNRAKWNAYVKAANDMFAYTNTNIAPWHIIEAEDKRYGRISVLEQVVRHLEIELAR